MTSHLKTLACLTNDLIEAGILLNSNIRISLIKRSTIVRVWVQGDQFRPVEDGQRKVFQNLPHPGTGEPLMGEAPLRKVGNLRLFDPETGQVLEGVADVVSSHELAIQAACANLNDKILHAYQHVLDRGNCYG